MKCLFVHDFRSFKKSGNIYTTNLSYEILNERYVNVFGELNILNRSGKMGSLQSEKGLVKASGKSINFIDQIGIFTPISFFKGYFKIRKVVNRYVSESEYIIIRLDSFLGLIAAEYCRKYDKKYLIEVVGCVWDSFWNKGIYGKIVALPLFKRMQFEVKKAPYVVYVTSEFLQNRYPTEGQNTNISNVQIKHLEDSVIEKRVEKIQKFDCEHIYEIVTIASVEVRYKGQETVIRALMELKKRGYKNFRYHLIGGGNNSYLKNLASELGVIDQVVFHGSMNHDMVMNFLDDCDIYIQPSKQEGLPRSLIEGMSRGLICYGTCVAGIPELLETKMLFSIKKDNYIELANKMLLIDKELYEQQARRNFKEAKKYEESILEKRRKEFFEIFREQKLLLEK